MPESNTRTSLNDAAALLIGMDAEDLSELSQLETLLQAVFEDMTITDNCRRSVDSALEKIGALKTPSVSSSGIESELTEIGKGIENALNALDEEEKVEERLALASDDRETGTDRADTALEAEPEPEPETEPEAEPETDRETDRETEVIPWPAFKPRADEREPKAEESASSNPREFLLPESTDLDMMDAFLTESADLIGGAEEALLTLEENPEDMDAVSTVFRAFHTIKGTSGFLELKPISDLAHRAESLLSQVRDREIRYGGGYADLALRSIDLLKDLLATAQGAINGKPFLIFEEYDELIGLLDHPEAAGSETASSETPSSETPSQETREPETDASSSEEPMFDADAALSDKDAGEEEKAFAPSSPISDKNKKEEADEKKTTSRDTSKGFVESSIRVPVDRLDRFIDMVGELVVAHSMVAQDEVVTDGQNHELLKKVGQSGKIVRELQGMSMSMRMIPLKTTFQKMARLVRDLSRKAGKNITFFTEGEDTEIDRNMVDIINDPLVHMVRNAVDHGIESPTERERAGKPVNGTVQLDAYHSAGNVVVEIRDDGKGLDREGIIAKAGDRGLIADREALTDREIYNLIFEPGFSTAATISEVSGRGVGMDVVKTNIESLRGSVEIQSTPGRGCLFKMSLPLTLAIIDGMVVRLRDQKYVIPTISIVRSVQPEKSDMNTVFQRGEMLKLQGRLIPLFRLGELFGIEGAETDYTKAIVVVVEDDDRQAGLMVDELIGSQQIVIKTLGEALGDIPGISGSAIMPNGRVGLILDVGGLVRMANEKKRGAAQKHEPDVD